MDNALLVLLSKFSVAARPIIGAINPAKVLKDAEYAKKTFELADTQGDEQLLLLSLELQNKLGLLEVDIKPPAPTIKEEAPSEKYLFGARG
ncbi:MAG TPA: hypothetical protein VGD04_04070 [Methylophilus sp.]